MRSKDDVIQIRIDPVSKQAYGIAANFAGMSLSRWLRYLADKEIKGEDKYAAYSTASSWEEEYLEAVKANSSNNMATTPPG